MQNSNKLSLRKVKDQDKFRTQKGEDGREIKVPIYTYRAADGSVAILEPGKITTTLKDGSVTVEIDDGITVLIIQELNRMENREVESNLRYVKSSPTPEMEEQNREWERKHPGATAQGRWNTPLEFSDDDDENNNESKNKYITDYLYEADECQEELRAFICTLSEREQRLYDLRYIQRKTNKYIANKFGVSEAAISKAIKRLEQKIIKNFQKFSGEG